MISYTLKMYTYRPLFIGNTNVKRDFWNWFRRNHSAAGSHSRGKEWNKGDAKRETEILCLSKDTASCGGGTGRRSGALFEGIAWCRFSGQKSVDGECFVRDDCRGFALCAAVWWTRHSLRNVQNIKTRQITKRRCCCIESSWMRIRYIFLN